MRFTPEVHAYSVRAREIHAREIHAREIYTREMYAHEVHVHKVHAYGGFYEDPARQNTVAHLSQLQLRFRCRHIWVSMLSHMGFSCRRGVLKATI
jgi:hypothetical protein